MSYQIRRLNADDADAYRAIRLEALTNHPEAYGTSPERFSARPMEALRTLLGQLAIFGAFSDTGALVGIVAFEAEADERRTHRGWLVQVYVQPQMRGKGCADALIDATIDHARGRVIQIHLMVGAHNAPAIELYRRAGFALYGTDPRCLFVNGHYIDEHLMVRFLDKEDRA